MCESIQMQWKQRTTDVVLFGKGDGRTAVVKAAGILLLRFYYAVRLY